MPLGKRLFHLEFDVFFLCSVKSISNCKLKSANFKLEDEERKEER